MNGLLAALIDLDGRPHYVHSGWFLISVANLGVIVAMIAVLRTRDLRCPSRADKVGT